MNSVWVPATPGQTVCQVSPPLFGGLPRLSRAQLAARRRTPFTIALLCGDLWLGQHPTPPAAATLDTR